MKSITALVEDDELVTALARLKNIPVRKVLHNAAKDFAQAAWMNTPVANEPKKRYYRVKKGDQWIYIPAEDIENRRKKLSTKKRLALGIQKVPFHKGWSRAAWIGVFRSLGMPGKGSVGKLPSAVVNQGYTTEQGTNDDPVVEILDSIHFDRFGRDAGDTKRSDRIVQCGFNLAAQRIAKGVHMAMKKAWSKQ